MGLVLKSALVGVILGGLLSPSVTQVLIPRTLPKHFTPCAEVIDVGVEFARALTCSAIALPELDTAQLQPPTCYVISKASPDVYRAPEGFSFVTTGFTLQLQVLGFYDGATKTVYVVENEDQAETYYHELFHFLLDSAGVTDKGHNHKVFRLCAPPYYVPKKPLN